MQILSKYCWANLINKALEIRLIVFSIQKEVRLISGLELLHQVVLQVLTLHSQAHQLVHINNQLRLQTHLLHLQVEEGQEQEEEEVNREAAWLEVDLECLRKIDLLLPRWLVLHLYPLVFKKKVRSLKKNRQMAKWWNLEQLIIALW